MDKLALCVQVVKCKKNLHKTSLEKIFRKSMFRISKE